MILIDVPVTEAVMGDEENASGVLEDPRQESFGGFRDGLDVIDGPFKVSD